MPTTFTKEDLAGLTTEELFDLVRERPDLMRQIGALDPRARLMEEFYQDPDAKKDLLRHGKRLHPKAAVPEVDIPADVETRLKPALDKIDKLEKELGEIKDGGKRAKFRASLTASGADEADLDDIEQFMVDNEYGPKAAAAAVRAFYETKETAEPNTGGKSDLSMTMPEGGGAEHIKALLAAGPEDDLDIINAPFVEQIVKEEFGGGKSRSSRPALA